MNLFTLATSLKPNGSFEFTLTVVIAGIGIVLATLALLILIFDMFGKAVSTSQRKAQERKNKQLEEKMKADGNFPEPPKVTSATLPPPPPIAEEGIAPEVVAAISAAVYMMEGSTAAVTSIKRKKTVSVSRSAWAQAAVIDNTRPF